MSRLFYIAAALFCAAVPFNATAQTPATARIEGRVRDAASGAAIAGVVVHVEDPRRHEVTHDDGEFHLTQLPPGRYTVTFERVGYASRAVEVALGVGQTVTLDVDMLAAPVEFEGLVVTATMGGRAADDALRPTSLVTGRDLQRQMDATLAGTLEAEAGVAVASMGPAPARPVIRGLGGDRVLILEDGQRVGDVSATSPDHAVALDPLAAERIEVVRGPAALFYGSNAIGGVVNVITEEIPATLPDRLQGSGTLQGRSASGGFAGEGSLVAPVGSLALSAGAAYRSAGDLTTPLGAVDNTSTSTFDGALGGAWVNGWGHAGMAARFYATEYGVPPHSEEEEGHEGHGHDVRVEMDRAALRGQLHWTRQAAWFDHVELNAKATQLDHREIEGGGEVGTEIGLNTVTAELVGRNSGSGVFDRGAFGARVQRGDYDAVREGGAPLTVEEWDAALYALEELDVGRLQFQAGARVDFARRDPVRGPESVAGAPVRERDFANVAGSLSALYRVFESMRLGVALTRAFRTPSSDELFSEGAHLASYTFEVGNPDLEAEIGHGLDVFLRIDQPSLRGEVAAFWNRIDDYVHPANTGVVDPESQLFVYRASNTEADFRGAEAALRWSPLESIAFDGSVSYVRADNRTTDEPLPLIPPMQADVAVRWETPSWFVQAGWHAAADQNRVPARPELPPASVGWCDRTDHAAGCVETTGEFLPTEGYSTFSVGVGASWFAWGALSSVTLSLENIGDVVYRNHLSRIKEVMPEQGRSLNLVYRVSF
ncbi:MAG TPA: TonB-dependent receptor [Longimicrobiales bacterium]